MNQKIKDFLRGGTLAVVGMIGMIVVMITLFLLIYLALFVIGFTLVTGNELIGKELTIVGVFTIVAFCFGGTYYTHIGRKPSV